MRLSKHKIQPRYSTSALTCVFPTIPFPARYLLRIPKFCLRPPLTEIRVYHTWEPSEPSIFTSHVNNKNSVKFFVLNVLAKEHLQRQRGHKNKKVQYLTTNLTYTEKIITNSINSVIIV